MFVRDFLAKLIPTDLFEGLRVTFGYLPRKKFTVQYPEKRLEPTDRFRGMFGYDPERCTICNLCAKACPIGIIYISSHREEDPETGKKKRVLDRYDIDVKRCMFCGLCEDACPTEPKSVWLTTKTYEAAGYDRDEDLYFTKEKLLSWEGVEPFPGVLRPGEGQDPRDPKRRLAAGGEEEKGE